MLAVLKAALLNVGKKVIIAAVSERVLKRIIISLLEEGAKRTEWTVDDEIVADIKKALE